LHLVIYGDFNCPFSALASERAARVQAARRATVEWRAVQRLPDLPSSGRLIDSKLAADLAEELDRIDGLLLDDERFPRRLPDVLPSTQPATAAFAAAADLRDTLRQLLFRAHWFDGLDISDPTILVRLGARPAYEPPVVTVEWQRAWEGLGRPVTPMMTWSDGNIRHGVEVLDHLAELLTFGTQRAAS